MPPTYDAGIAVRRRTPAWPLFGLGALALLLAAIAGARVVSAEPNAALAAPVLLMLAVAGARAPTAVAIGLVAVAGVSGTFFAYTKVNPQLLTDGLLAGLWAAVACKVLVVGRRQEDTARALWPAVGLFGLFLLVSALATAAAPSVLDGLRSFRGSQWLMTAALLPLVAQWDERVPTVIVRGMVLVGLAVGVYACVRYAIGPATRELIVAISGGNTYRGRRSVDLPLLGSFGSPKTLGLWTAVMIPLAFASALNESAKWRAVAVLTCGTSAVALFGSQTRTALVAAIVGLVVVLGLQGFARAVPGLRLGSTVLAAMFAAGVLAGGFAIASKSDGDLGSRFAELRAPGEVESLQIRRARWSQALLGVRSDVLGSGLGTTSIVAAQRPATAQDRRALDSSYVKIASEQGILAVMFVVAVLLLLAHICYATARVPGRSTAALGVSAAGALAAMLVMMYATVAAEQLAAVVVWLVVGLAVAELSRRPYSQRSNSSVVGV